MRMISLCLQKLNNELQDTLAERESLKTQVQQYILEVRRVEDMLASKVRLICVYRVCVSCLRCTLLAY